MSPTQTDVSCDPAAPASTVDRRKFLIGAGAAVAASALVAQQWPFGGTGEDDLPGLQLERFSAGHARLAVGYVEGSGDPEADLGTVPYGLGRVVPGRAGRGDGSFEGATARVTIRGLTSGFAGGTHPRFTGVDVAALLPHPRRSVHEPLRHFAWTLRSSPFHLSSPTGYTVAIGRRPRIGFTLDVTDRAGTKATATTVFATGAGADSVSLRRGTYLLGLDPGAWSTERALPSADDPAWTDLVSIVVTVAHA